MIAKPTHEKRFFKCAACSKQCFFFLYLLFRFNVLQTNLGTQLYVGVLEDGESQVQSVNPGC